MNIELRGGKTAPRLLVDLTQYDPRSLPPTYFNILSDLIFHDENQSSPPLQTVGKGSCRHAWCLKSNQCEISGYEFQTPDPRAWWHIAAFCSICRSHLDFRFEYSTATDPFLPCPNEQYPLHHFRHLAEISTSWRDGTRISSEPGFAWVDRQHFQCTSPTCAAKLTISFKPPRLRREWVELLTDKELIRTRAEEAMAKNPERFEGIAVPSSVNVLEYLSLYLKNALFDPDPSRKIKKDNKKFATSLGTACSDLLHYLGFEIDGDFWLPPRPSSDQRIPFIDAQKILLDDVQDELSVLMSKEPTELVRSTRQIFQPAPAMPELSAILACKDYRRRAHSQIIDMTAEEHPCYAGLGAFSDFHDVLVVFAYDCQIATDGKNTAYYLECLQVLAFGRESEELQTKAAIEQTNGRISLKDVRLAYANLGFDMEDRTLADNTIIGTFQARISDAPKQEAEMRHNLRIIGQSRASDKIRLAASQDVTTYEQAMRFLSAEETTADEFIPSMFSLKVSEKQSDEAVARQAVILIANQRKSQALKTWLETGNLGEIEMDVGQAYTRLDITDRTIDDDAILAAYDINVGDQPSQADDLNRALTSIAKSRNSKTLRERLGLGPGEAQHPLSEWPVGIENIGNTCYLNSLLQFYFTIKPLRDLVLHIDEFKMPVDESNLRSKRVGSRNITKKEVDRAQRFVDELQELFKDLIISTKSSLKPSPDVARLTLLSSSKAEIARRQSLISPDKPSFGPGLGQIDGMLVQGPLGPSPGTKEEADVIAESPVIVDRPNFLEDTSSGDHQSDATSDTLVNGLPTHSDPMDLDTQKTQRGQQSPEDKENLAPSTGIALGKETANIDQAGTENSFSTSSVELDNSSDGHPVPNLIDLDEEKVSAEGKTMETLAAPQKPPNRPPPFPPRPKVQRDNPEAIREAEYGAQQDVTEVIANVLFQLQCAIRPESTDENGEQLDQIKTLFFGRQKSYITDKKGTVRTSEEYITDIKVDVASGPRDIYAALDGAFDVQEVEVGGGIEPQYATISRLPPILSILIQRAQFDPAKKTPFKSDNHLELIDPIYLDRYQDSTDSDLKERREESWNWKRQVHVLERRKAQLVDSGMDVPVAELLQITREYVQQIKDADDTDLAIPRTLVANIEGAAKEAQQELDELETKIRDLKTNISSQFSDMRKIPYRLAAVFMHVGSHNTGHYWIYIYDFKKHLWRKYNDEKITEVMDIKEIFEAPGTVRPPTPYYLVYVKDNLKEYLVDPVCREVPEAPPEEIQDVPMEDYKDIPINFTSEMIADAYRPINTQNAQIAKDGAWFPVEPHDSHIQW